MWVFNSSVQIDHQGLLIPKSEQQYIILDDQNILDVPHLTGEYKSNQSGGSKPRNNGVGGGGESGFIFHAVPAFVPPFVSSFLTKLQGGGGVGPPLNALKLA